MSHWKVASGGQGKCGSPIRTRMVEDLKISYATKKGQGLASLQQQFQF